MPSRCPGIGRGRGAVRPVTRTPRLRCRPGAAASASAAGAGPPVIVESQGLLAAVAFPVPWHRTRPRGSTPSHTDATSSLPPRCYGFGGGRGCGDGGDCRINGLTRRRCRPDASHRPWSRLRVCRRRGRPDAAALVSWSRVRSSHRRRCRPDAAALVSGRGCGVPKDTGHVCWNVSASHVSPSWDGC